MYVCKCMNRFHQNREREREREMKEEESEMMSDIIRLTDHKKLVQLVKTSKDPTVMFLSLRTRWKDIDDVVRMNALSVLLNRLERSSRRFERYLRDAAEMSLETFQVKHAPIHLKAIFGESNEPTRRSATLHGYLMRLMWRCRGEEVNNTYYHLVKDPLQRLEESCAAYRREKYLQQEEEEDNNDDDDNNNKEIKLGTSLFACYYILSGKIPLVLSHKYLRKLVGHHLVRLTSVESHIPKTMTFVLKSWCHVMKDDEYQCTYVFDQWTDGDAIRALGDVATLCPDKSSRDLARLYLESDMFNRLNPSRCCYLIWHVLEKADEKIVPSLAAYFIDVCRRIALKKFEWQVAWDVAMYGIRDLDKRELVEWSDVVVASLNTIRALMLRGGRGLNSTKRFVSDHLNALSTVADAKENELRSRMEKDPLIHLKLSKIYIIQEVLSRVRDLFSTSS